MLQEFRKRRSERLGAHRKGLRRSISLIQVPGRDCLLSRVKAKGIDASEPQVGNSLWVTGLRDPDGYRLFFSSRTDVAEETKLSERPGRFIA